MTPPDARSLIRLVGEWGNAHLVCVSIKQNSKGHQVETKKLTEEQANAVQGEVEKFTSREIPGFVEWMRLQWELNAPALLCSNPPNHVYDVEDGTVDLSIGEVDVAGKREHYDYCKGGIYAFAIKAEGKLRKVVRAIPTFSSEQQLEAAMAFLLEHRKGSYVCNTVEWREVAAIVGHSTEGLDGPFYRGVCETVLEVFRKERWID